MMSVQGSCNERGINRTMVFLKKKQVAYLRPHDQIRFDTWQFDRRVGGQGWHNNWNYFNIHLNIIVSRKNFNF
jgi:hypothetical protein